MILPRFSPFFQKRTVILPIFNRDFLTVLHIVGKLSKLWSWHPATTGVVRWPSAGDTVVSRVFSDARPWRTARRRADAKRRSADASRRRHRRTGPLRYHRLLRWTCRLQRPPPVYVSTTYRPWRRLYVETFRQELRPSALCCSEIVPEDVDSMADM